VTGSRENNMALEPILAKRANQRKESGRTVEKSDGWAKMALKMTLKMICNELFICKIF
jgi:hypothetical protein